MDSQDPIAALMAERARQVTSAMAQHNDSETARKESAATSTNSATVPTTPATRAWTWRVVVMTVLVSMGGMIFGYGGIGAIGGFLAMKDYNNRFGTPQPNGSIALENTRTGTIVGQLMIGALVGSLGAGSLADKIGRKHSISLWAALYMVGAIIELTSMKAWYQIVIGRSIEGLGIGGLSILVPMYQSECTPKQVRGVVISMYQLFITLGILLASFVNLVTNHIAGSASWRITIGIGLVWPLILGIGIQFLEESPHWAVRNGRADNARAALSKLYSSEADAQRELHDIQAAVSREGQQRKPGWRELFTERTILRRFVVGMVLQMMQQLTGINYFFYFGTTLFSTLGVGNGYITAVILGAVNFGATFVGLWVAKRFGHREALVLGGVWIGAFLLLYAVFGHYCVSQPGLISANSAGIAMIIFTCMAIIGFATTWGPLIWVVCAEIFPPQWKATGMGAATATNWIFNFLIGFFTNKVTASIGYGFGWVFAGSILVGAGFVWLFVHETQGKSLEEIDMEILEGTPAWRSRKGRG